MASFNPRVFCRTLMQRSFPFVRLLRLPNASSFFYPTSAHTRSRPSRLLSTVLGLWTARLEILSRAVSRNVPWAQYLEAHHVNELTVWDISYKKGVHDRTNNQAIGFAQFEDRQLQSPIAILDFKTGICNRRYALRNFKSGKSNACFTPN